MIYSNLTITANYRKERSISYRNFLTKLTTLARNLIPNIYAGLIGFFREIINSDQFIKQHRQRPTYFIRQRKLTFSTLIFSLINKEMGLDLPPLKLRLLRVESDTGESEILISGLIYPTQAIIAKNTENHIYRYKRNFAEVLSKTKDVILLLFLRPLWAVGGLISDEPVRPGRKCPRNFNNRSGRFHLGIAGAPLS